MTIIYIIAAVAVVIFLMQKQNESHESELKMQEKALRYEQDHPYVLKFYADRSHEAYSGVSENYDSLDEAISNGEDKISNQDMFGRIYDKYQVCYKNEIIREEYSQFRKTIAQHPKFKNFTVSKNPISLSDLDVKNLRIYPKAKLKLTDGSEVWIDKPFYSHQENAFSGKLTTWINNKQTISGNCLSFFPLEIVDEMILMDDNLLDKFFKKLPF